MRNDEQTTAWFPARLFAFLQPLAKLSLDMVFPPCCAGCGRVDTVWCDICAAELSAVPLDAKHASLDAFHAIASTGIHEGRLRDAVHALKYATPDIADSLGLRLTAALDALDWQIDLIIPVPLHPERLLERGYNQAQRLAEVVSLHTGITCDSDAVIRHRNTGHQVGLNALERQYNVANAFAAHQEQVAGKRLLILDDVFTTGATFNACAQAAKISGAAEIYGLSVTVAYG